MDTLMAAFLEVFITVSNYPIAVVEKGEHELWTTHIVILKVKSYPKTGHSFGNPSWSSKKGGKRNRFLF